MAAGRKRVTMYRGCIYFFYDRDGIVDDYVTYLLRDLSKHLQELVVVVNGKLTEEGHKRFEEFTRNILVRENQGLDVGAYKAGLDFFGWDKVESFDELIMLNHTILGPVYPFQETFDKMDKLEVDFWGITKHEMNEKDPYGKNPYRCLPEHIQSHFLVYRQRLLRSKEFHEYWEKHLSQVKTYSDSVGLHESYFTKFFSDLGYKWAVSVDVEDMKQLSDYPVLYCPVKMIREKRCPIFKRRTFFHRYSQFLETTAGQATYELFHYLEDNHLYDTEMIWQNALRTMNHVDLAKQLQLNYTLPTNLSHPLPEGYYETHRLALFMHIYYTDELPNMKKYIDSMPPQADFFVTTQTEEKKQEILEFLKDYPNHIEIRIVENRGRDVAAFTIAGREIMEQYDLICFIHDKKVTQASPGSVGEGFAYVCYENTLKNRDYVENVLWLFEQEKHLGVLCPPKPVHGAYILSLANNWEKNYPKTLELLQELQVDVPIDEHKPPIAPYGSCFWFRPKAIKKLYAKEWKYDDFTAEPLPADGTISHAVERIYPFLAQDAGYYAAVGMADTYAKIEYTDLMDYASIYVTDQKFTLMQRGVVDGVKPHPVMRFLCKHLLPKKLFTKLMIWKRKVIGPHVEYQGE